MKSKRQSVNRGFGITLLGLLLLAELAVRTAPAVSPFVFRVLYGNALSMYMTVGERLRQAAPEVEVLALGDSLAMTQFQPGVFSVQMGLSEGRVFNAAYSGMSFPSQERLLRSIGLDRLERLRVVIYFLNPSRFSLDHTPNTDVFRVAVPDPKGPWREVLERRQLSPLLDASRLYGLSRHLTLTAWRMLVQPPVWDHIEFLQPNGGVAWDGTRSSKGPPRYPYREISDLSPERLAEMRRVIDLFRSRGIDVRIVPSAIHPAVDQFASQAVRRAFDSAISIMADESGSSYLPDAMEGFSPPQDTDFCDYGHMNRSGGVAYTAWLARLGGELAPQVRR